MSNNQWLLAGAVVVVVVVLAVWQPWKKKEVKKTHIPAIERIVTA